MSIEKALVETLEPIAQEISEIKKTIATIETTPGRDGLGIEVKTWSDGVYREGSFVTHNIGQIFKAVRDTASEPGSDETWERIGKSGFRHRGAFDDSVTYSDGDTYIKNYGWFLVLDGEHKCIAGRGEKGQKGEKGEIGLPGVAGRDGADIVAAEVRGLTAVIITKTADGELDEISLDFAPAIEKQIADMGNTVAYDLEKGLEDMFQNTVLTHPSDPDATPLRFFRGNWYATDSYSTGDVVIYSAKLFVAVQDTPPGNLPGGNKSLLDVFVDDKYWRVVHAGGSGGGGGESLQMGLLNALQDQVNAIQVGLLHQVAVQDIINIPPATPKEGDRYIVGLAPTGVFVGRENHVAFYGSSGWEFKLPEVGNAHYVNETQKSVVWNGQHWVMLPRQAKVSLQADAPLDPNPGDTWLDNAGSKLEVKYFDGTSWITSSGTRTFSQQSDPQLANTMKDGDVWVQTFPQDATTGVTPPPITKVWTAGSWSTTTPSIPASSRTYMQSEVPTAGARGDTWIDLASGKPLVKYYDGLSWIDSGGTRTFSQTTDPKKDVPPKVVNEGDLWSDATDPKAVKIYQWTAGKWVQVNAGGGIFIPEAPPSLIKGVWYKKFTPATTPNVPVTNPGMWASYGANDVSFTTGNISTNCPVPSKYRTAQDHFKITVSYKTTQRCNGEIWERFYFEHNGSYNIVSKDIRMETDIPTGFAQFYCHGNSQAMQWIIVRLLGRNGGTLPTSLSFFSEVEVQWELLSI